MIKIYVRAWLYKQPNTVLLLRHTTESFGKGLYGMVGGNVKQTENIVCAVQRKVWEEVGLHIPKKAFLLVHVMNRKNEDAESLIICFKVDITAF